MALRLERLSSIAFERRLDLVTPTTQTCFVVAPEALGAACRQRVFRLLLQLPIRDQVFTAFVDFHENGQHRCPSVHFGLLSSSSRSAMTRVAMDAQHRLGNTRLVREASANQRVSRR